MLLDIIMPRKDGLDTLREVRQIRPLLPIVMLSGSCSTPHVIQAMKSGANDFLQKPVSFEDFRASPSRRPFNNLDRTVLIAGRWFRFCTKTRVLFPVGARRSMKCFSDKWRIRCAGLAEGRDWRRKGSSGAATARPLAAAGEAVLESKLCGPAIRIGRERVVWV